MEKICLHCFVSGQVQGVFYRRWASELAVAQGLTGWVKNLSDDRVEILICGEEKAVYEMQNKLWQGPLAAKVSDVEINELLWQALPTFEVRN